MGLPFLFTFWYIFVISSTSHTSIATSNDTLGAAQVLYDNQTLVSSGQRFELGFFSPGNSSHRYLGIWYKNLPLTVVWIANRNNPITSNSSSLRINLDGQLVLYNDTIRVWGANMTVPVTRPLLQLLNNGNLVVREENSDDSEGYYWESFDYPSDTMLPEMKLGWDLKTGFHRIMTSWNTADDPSEGEFTFSLDPPELPQLVLRRGSEKQYRWGPWDGVRFSGSKELKINPVFKPFVTSNAGEVYYAFELTDESILLRFVVTNQGIIQYLTWSNHSNEWVNMVILQRENCDRYKMCGPYGNCYTDDPSCRCLKGFEPKSPQDWERVDWSGGCARKWELDCGNGDGFVKYKGLKLPDNSHVWELGSKSLSPEECEAECLKNCSCLAYTNIDIHGNGSQCVVWSGDLVDMRNFPQGGDELYIRMAAAELESIAHAKRKKRVVKISVIIILTAAAMLLFGVSGWYISRKRRAKRKVSTLNEHSVFSVSNEVSNLNDWRTSLKNLHTIGAESIKNVYKNSNVESLEEDLELPLFDLETISAATNKFSSVNKIGEGGFGPVYKGELPTGQEIAVKRLSQTSGQGPQEFKNEVSLIAKLQHRNLVKLLGCCIQGEERILIYEYLPNKSLNYFIFDNKKRTMFTWKKRFDIVMGIARGLLYLHQDSRLRIIHRDLKTSNILLDSEMNPKISDFGIARIFGDQTEEKTKRVIGTYGYMSPEYAISGHFSVKSDVFSFGVLVLEIISGQKNRGFYHPDHDLNLLGHAWKLWNEGSPLELIDALMEDSVAVNEVVRCIQVGLLCVQQRPEDRPTMSSAVFMLGNEIPMVAQPKEPGFCTENSSMGIDSLSSEQYRNTANEVTVTELDGR